MKYIYDADIPEISGWVISKGFPRYRAAQIMEWIPKGITSFDRMTNVSAEIRQALSEDFYADGVIIQQKIESAMDGTIKYILRLKDGNIIECVLMRYKHGNSICVSSQAGCKMRCSFCASTSAGFGRDLTHGEMIAQVLTVSADIGERISNIVVMGIGEPFDNYDNLVLFIKAANAPEISGIGMRHIAVSTCGLVDEMLKFTAEGFPVTLSISLHAPNDGIRRQLMPIASRYSMDQLLSACRQHIRISGRRITFEYILIAGVNDLPEHAAELAGRLRRMLCHVNLIPANEFEGCGYKQSSVRSVNLFKQILTDAGINATVRRELGSDISAACGQLRRNLIEGEPN
ncbi:MAG: 23S rRNA (adenine(2503)-C(2))-methyltransferase RlmN [Saccharofermentanales bacterium]